MNLNNGLNINAKMNAVNTNTNTNTNLVQNLNMSMSMNVNAPNVPNVPSPIVFSTDQKEDALFHILNSEEGLQIMALCSFYLVYNSEELIKMVTSSLLQIANGK